MTTHAETEILICGMAELADGSASLADGCDMPPKFWDVMVRGSYVDLSGESLMEVDNLTLHEATIVADLLESVYPDVDVNWV